MATTSRLAIAVGVVGLAASASASAAVTLYYDNFSSLSPPAGGFQTTTAFGSGDHAYKVAGSPYGIAANVDIVSSGYQENGVGLCAAGFTACIDLDGTGPGRKEDYFFTTSSFALNTTDTYELTVYANATTRSQQSPFLFGLLSPTSDAVPLSYGSNPHSYLTVGPGGDEAIIPGFQYYTYRFTLGDLSLTSGTSARLFFENITNGANSDNIGAVIQSIQFTNVTAVPLPAAAWLLLSGLGGVGLFARRRRKEDSKAVAA